jgi:hypothetical protein
MQHAIPGIHMHTQGQTEHCSFSTTGSIYFASHNPLQIPLSRQLTDTEHQLHPQSQLEHHHKICWQSQKIKEFIHLQIHLIFYIYLTILSGIIREVINIFDTNLFLLNFIFLLQFFEGVTRRKSYAVPNSKNIHVPTPHESISVLPTHF